MIRMSSRRRRLLVFCALAALAAVAGIAALHTPWARARVLAAVLARIVPEGSVHVDRLDYRLPTLWFRLHGLQLRTPGQERSYFDVDELTLDLPWSSAWRGLAFQHVELRKPRLTVFVAADGSSNFEGGGMRVDATVPVERLRISELQIEWRDAAVGYEFDAGDIRLDLGDAIEPRLEMPGTASLRVGHRQAEIELSRGQLSWDGRNLGIDQLRFDSTAAQLEIDGTVERLLADRELTLDVRTQALLGTLAELGGLDVAGGALSVAGRLSGPAMTPTVDMTLDIETALSRGVSLRRLHGHIQADQQAIRIDALRAELGGGDLTGDLHIGLAAGAVSRMRWENVDPAPLLAAALSSGWIVPATRLSGEVHAEWPGPAPAIADITASVLMSFDGSSPDAGAVAVDGRLEADLSAGVWRTSVDADVAAGLRIGAELTGAVEGRTLDGTAHLTVDNVGSVARRLIDVAPDLLGVLARADGQATADLAITGSVLEPRISGHADVEQLRFGATGWLTAAADIVTSGDSIALHDASLQFPGGTMKADLELNAGGHVAGRVRGSVTDLEAALDAVRLGERLAASGGVSGSLDWDLTLAGPLPLPGIEGTVDAHAIRVADGISIDAQARLSPTTHGIRIDELTASAGSNQLRVRGVINPGGEHIDLLGELDLTAPGNLGDRPELAYIESARAEVAVGVDLATSTVVVDLWSLHVDLPRFPVRSVIPGRVTWSPTEVSVEDLVLRVGDLDLSVAGALGSDPSLPGLHGRLRGDLSRLSDLATMGLALATGAPDTRRVVLSGDLDADLHVGGTLLEPQPAGSVRIIDGEVELNDTATLESLQLQASVDGRGLHVGELRGRWRGAELEADAEVPLALILGDTERPTAEPAVLRARLGPVLAAELAPLLGPELTAEFDGEATLSLQVAMPTLELADARADLQLDSLRLSSNGVTVSQLRPTRVRLEDGAMRIVDWIWTQPGKDDVSLVVAGAIELGDRQQLDLQLESHLQLDWIAPMIEAGVVEGGAHATLEITGTATRPSFDGRIELTDVGFISADPQIVVSDVNGTLTITNTEIHTDGLRGIVNGGTATLFLDFDLADPMSPTGLAGITARSIVVEGGGGRALGDVDVTISAPPQGGLRAFGEIRLLAGGYRTDASLAADLLGASAATQVRASAVPTPLDDLSYDIRVNTVDDLRIDTPYAELGLAADLQIVGTFARPGVVGRLTVREGGIVRLAGNAYSVDLGVIEFAETNRVAPTLNIAARAEIGGEQISVVLTGSAFNPTVEASAESGLDSGDVLSLMATGRTVAAAGDAGREVLAEQAFDLLTGQYLAGAVRQLGFESVRFERGGVPAAAQSELFPRHTDLAARLTLTRSIKNTFDLVFSQNLTNADERSWIGTVRLPFGLALRGGTFDDGTRSVELQHRLVLGGDARGASARRPAPRVRSVQFEGSSGYTEYVLRRKLRVGLGDRFDFLRWQEDRDRLLRLYHQRGYLEADISARRSPPAGTDRSEITGIDLTYAIDRGPETVLTVEGDLPNGVRQELLETWGDSVLTEFLLEDMRQIVRAYLAKRGHVRPAVAVELIGDGARKEILLRFDPGERYRRGESSIVGNAFLDTEAIRRRLREQGLAATDWTQGDELASAVRALYVERGWVDAIVQASGPEIDGDDARMRIEIEEGNRYRLGQVSFTGNAAVGEATLREVLATRLDGAYDRGELAMAVDAVLEAYLQRGHNGTTVRATIEANAETSRVDVVMHIDEAPQQILTDVRIDGLERVRRSVVSGAVRAQRGAPLVLRDVQAARQRLYATGVFERIKLEVQSNGPSRNGRQPVFLLVEVEEQPRLRLRYGVQLFSDETLEDQRQTRPGIAATLSHSALLGLPAELSATARYRGKDRLVRGVLGFRGFFGAPVRTSLIGELSRSETEGFFTTRVDDTRFTLEQRLRLSSSLTVGYSYNFKRARSTLIGQDFQLEPVTSARLVPTIIHDTRDDRLEPSRGLFQSATLEWAPTALESELLFRKLHLQQYAFFSLGRLTFASAIRFGSGASLDPTSTQLPRSERFVAGGSTSLRGYPDDAVGGTEFFGSFVPGGNAVLVLNQEVRFPIWHWIRGVGFLDAGSAFATASDLRLGRLQLSTGLGLRLVTPYLTLRFDYGVRLSDLSHLPDAPGGRFHFGIGHIF